MRFAWLLPLLVLGPAVSAQTLRPKLPVIQHITVAPAASSESVAAGGTLTLFADVTPKPNMHVYSSDTNGTTPVALVLTQQAGVSSGQAKYPMPEMVRTVGEVLPVAAYRKPFRIEQPITIARTAKSGETLSIVGLVNYQACDDRVCYPAGSVPVSWNIKIK
jgi:DsbC/DsbD-like thiol-disulfide interchange protein